MDDWRLESSWKPWFAWFPVKTVSGQRVWFKNIFRKEKLYRDYQWGGTYRTGYDYATLFDILR